ncbi:hypothetical protein [Actinoplanes couchii]|nr:hypothetical protein [Actinoplanes couchii]MDR6319174.1 hypothetical protein [Actinoplanes couchii]
MLGCAALRASLLRYTPPLTWRVGEKPVEGGSPGFRGDLIG